MQIGVEWSGVVEGGGEFDQLPLILSAASIIALFLKEKRRRRRKVPFGNGGSFRQQELGSKALAILKSAQRAFPSLPSIARGTRLGLRLRPRLLPHPTVHAYLLIAWLVYIPPSAPRSSAQLSPSSLTYPIHSHYC